MRHLFQSSLPQAKDLAGVLHGVIPVLAYVREQGAQRIGYISGIITSDGPEHMERNWRQLALYTEQLRQTQAFPVFSPTDIFSDELFTSLLEMQLPSLERSARFHTFWRQVLGCGHVTDIFMTPRWEVSIGCMDEYETAKKIGLQIHYV